MHLVYRGVNQAFRSMIAGIHRGEIPTVKSDSRNGPVIRIPEPVTITFTHPRERVLFNKGRDANCFFHLFESLWMLAGRNDVAAVDYYAPMKKFSDDGVTLHGAYGYRWRNHFNLDQLDWIVQELKSNPETRRIVLGMYDPYGQDLGGLDIPCNTHAYFDIVDGKLNITVCNRSTDLVWGLLGANVVHFSMLLEYLACRIGVGVGLQHHFTNNLHIYTENNSGFHPDKWLQGRLTETEYADSIEDQTVNGGVLPGPMLLTEIERNAPIHGVEAFDEEVKQFIDCPYKEYHSIFLRTVAEPMCRAFRHHKARRYNLALEALAYCLADDWRSAGITWIVKRQQMWEAKQNVQGDNVYKACAERQGDLPKGSAVEPTSDST